LNPHFLNVRLAALIGRVLALPSLEIPRKTPHDAARLAVEDFEASLWLLGSNTTSCGISQIFALPLLDMSLAALQEVPGEEALLTWDFIEESAIEIPMATLLRGSLLILAPSVDRLGNFSLDGSSRQTGDAAFTPATPKDLQHSRANIDSHNTQLTRAKTKITHFTLCKKDTQSSQTCSGGHITPNPTQNRCG
jgi:hypothetical protein